MVAYHCIILFLSYYTYNIAIIHIIVWSELVSSSKKKCCKKWSHILAWSNFVTLQVAWLHDHHNVYDQTNITYMARHYFFGKRARQHLLCFVKSSNMIIVEFIQLVGRPPSYLWSQIEDNTLFAIVCQKNHHATGTQTFYDIWMSKRILLLHFLKIHSLSYSSHFLYNLYKNRYSKKISKWSNTYMLLIKVSLILSIILLLQPCHLLIDSNSLAIGYK